MLDDLKGMPLFFSDDCVTVLLLRPQTRSQALLGRLPADFLSFGEDSFV